MVSVHFFKPLLPDFMSGLDIPQRFFNKFLDEGSHKRVVELSSDISDTKWRVRLEGRRLTSGWKQFAVAHAYRVGDIIIFKYTGDLHFHVTGMGPSCCEIAYVKETDEQKTVTVRVTNDTIQRSRMYIPKEFADCNGLYTAGGQTISLMNEAGGKWPVKLLMELGDTRDRLRLTGGLANFLRANNFIAGNSISLQVIWENETELVLKVGVEGGVMED